MLQKLRIFSRNSLLATVKETVPQLCHTFEVFDVNDIVIIAIKDEARIILRIVLDEVGRKK